MKEQKVGGKTGKPRTEILASPRLTYPVHQLLESNIKSVYPPLACWTLLGLSSCILAITQPGQELLQAAT